MVEVQVALPSEDSLQFDDNTLEVRNKHARPDCFANCSAKSRSNARNISTQHLTTLLDRDVTCYAGAGQTRATSCNIQECCNKNLTIFKLDPTPSNMLLQGGQMRVTRCAQQCCKVSLSTAEASFAFGRVGSLEAGERVRESAQA